MEGKDAGELKGVVRQIYGSVASKKDKNEEASRLVAQAFGYSAEELASIPSEANMGLSCGNSIQIANLREGETVVDLGSGGGLDCFLAARKVGPKGQVIGIDMTDEMITLAMKNAAKMGSKALNCDFRKGEIEAIPVDDNSVDVVISNCVLNLVPDKEKAFKEIFRILKPGGRLAASDIALKKPLPDEVKKDVIAYTGCIAGAVLIDEYASKLESAGFASVRIIDGGADLNAYANLGTANCCAPPASEIASSSGGSGGGGCCGSSSASSTPAPAAAAAASSGCCAPATTAGDGCCAPPADTTKPCCDTTTCCVGDDADEKKQTPTPGLEAKITEILRKIDVNEYAASVKVLAVKPTDN